jgi:hypothetical protein
MSEVSLVADSDDKHAYVLPTFGRVRRLRGFRMEAVVEAPGQVAWQVSRGKSPWRFHSAWQAVEPGGRVVATLVDAVRRVERQPADRVAGHGGGLTRARGRRLRRWTRVDR